MSLEGERPREPCVAAGFMTRTTSCCTRPRPRPVRGGATQPRRRTLAMGIHALRSLDAACAPASCLRWSATPAPGARAAPPCVTLIPWRAAVPSRRAPRSALPRARRLALHTFGHVLRGSGLPSPVAGRSRMASMPSARSTPTSLSASCLRSSSYAGSRGTGSPSLRHADSPGGRASPRAVRGGGGGIGMRTSGHRP